MKKTFAISLAALVILLFINGEALANSWLQTDMANAKTWIDTSHWEQYQAWVDTSHYELRPYQVWLDTSHYELQTFQVWVSSGYWTSSYWETGWTYKNYFYDDNVISWQQSQEHLVVAASQSSDPRAKDWYNRVCATNDWWVTSSTLLYYGPFSNGDGSFRQLRRTWYTNMEKRGVFWRDYKLYSKSYGYETKSYGWSSRWVDTSHWETRTGWVWVPSGYWETRWGWVWVPSGYQETRWRWVSSGYWAEAHGQVSVSKNPSYIFTATHQMDNGEPAGLDLNVNWNLNQPVTGVRVYHNLVRYRDKGVICIDGAPKSVSGLGTNSGQGQYRLDYPKPGTGDSRLYIEFTLANNTAVRVWALVPVNGFDSTQKDNSSDPVWQKTLLDTDIVNF